MQRATVVVERNEEGEREEEAHTDRRMQAIVVSLRFALTTKQVSSHQSSTSFLSLHCPSDGLEHSKTRAAAQWRPGVALEREKGKKAGKQSCRGTTRENEYASRRARRRPVGAGS